MPRGAQIMKRMNVHVWQNVLPGGIYLYVGIGEDEQQSKLLPIVHGQPAWQGDNNNATVMVVMGVEHIPREGMGLETNQAPM